MIRLQVDEREIEARPGDSLLIAMLRAGLHPTGGGCLCLGGDCPHCLVTADGVAYTRSCQTPAAAGMVVKRDHRGEEAPPLLPRTEDAPPKPRNARAVPAAGDAGTEAAEGVETAPPPVRHVHCDTVVVGQGASGRRAAADARAASQDVVALDARAGQHVTGIYPGPLVVALDDAGRMLHVHPKREIVVATGTSEIQPVVPGNDLEGLVTARAAAELAASGIDLGRVVSLGEARVAAGPSEHRLPLGEGGWELLRFEGGPRVEAVVVRRHGDDGAPEERIECDTAVLGLGRQPRNALARMATDLPVRVVGGAAAQPELPPCPREGTVCPCSGVAVADLDGVWERGFREMELLKRATLAGTGACQGGVCLPYLRSFLLERSGRLQPAFTARPLNRQLTVRELAAGAHTALTARSPLHNEHLRLGARMERAGGWWRPWTYGLTANEARGFSAVGVPRPGRERCPPRWRPWTHGMSDAERQEYMRLDRRTDRTEEREPGNPHPSWLPRPSGDLPTVDPGALPGRRREDDTNGDEYDAVRHTVSLGDVGTLGKTAISGPDAEKFLERIVPSRVAALAPGRCRYVILLDERGYVFDDGILCRDDGDRFFLTSTSGGSDFLELWLRDWAEAFGFNVRVMNRTTSLAAVNVTGQWAARLLIRAGARELPDFGHHRDVRIAGVACRVLRVSFTGELSYELHHAAADAVELWRRLLAVGGELGARPHGLQTLLQVRLEKGHIVIGQDTDYDSTPRRLGLEWAVDLDKGDFIGRQAVLRTNRRPLDRRLVALAISGKRRVPFRPGQPWRETRDYDTLEGSTISDGDAYAGYVTSSPTGDRRGGNYWFMSRERLKPALHDPGANVWSGTGEASGPASHENAGVSVLAWVNANRDGKLPREVTIKAGTRRFASVFEGSPDDGPEGFVHVTIEGMAARRIDRPLVDPDGAWARAEVDIASEPASSIRSFQALEPRPTDLHRELPGPPRLRPLEATRVAAAPAALDALAARPPWPDDVLALRTADDELLVAAAPDFEVAGDPHAIVERETGFSWVRLDAAAAERFLDRECEWERPSARPALAQGAVAGIPVKLRLESGRTLILVPAPFAAAFQRRLDRALGSGGAGSVP